MTRSSIVAAGDLLEARVVEAVERHVDAAQARLDQRGQPPACGARRRWWSGEEVVEALDHGAGGSISAGTSRRGGSGYAGDAERPWTPRRGKQRMRVEPLDAPRTSAPRCAAEPGQALRQGMQYLQRKLQRSVIEIRTDSMWRPNESMSGGRMEPGYWGAAATPVRCSLTPRHLWSGRDLVLQPLQRRSATSTGGRPMSERWATFDCYGTIADWHGGMREAMRGGGRRAIGRCSRPTTGRSRWLEAEKPHRLYRDVLPEGLRGAAAWSGDRAAGRPGGCAGRGRGRGMPIHLDAPGGLVRAARSRAGGWRCSPTATTTSGPPPPRACR